MSRQGTGFQPASQTNDFTSKDDLRSALDLIYIYVKQYLQQFEEGAILIPANSSSAARAQGTPASNSIICGRSSSLSKLKEHHGPQENPLH